MPKITSTPNTLFKLSIKLAMYALKTWVAHDIVLISAF